MFQHTQEQQRIPQQGLEEVVQEQDIWIETDFDLTQWQENEGMTKKHLHLVKPKVPTATETFIISPCWVLLTMITVQIGGDMD